MPPDQAHPDRGCEYCADDANMFLGHVQQVASDEASRTLLLHCPRCGSLYEVAHAGPARATRLTEVDATARLSSRLQLAPISSCSTRTIERPSD